MKNLGKTLRETSHNNLPLSLFGFICLHYGFAVGGRPEDNFNVDTDFQYLFGGYFFTIESQSELDTHVNSRDFPPDFVIRISGVGLACCFIDNNYGGNIFLVDDSTFKLTSEILELQTDKWL